MRLAGVLAGEGEEENGSRLGVRQLHHDAISRYRRLDPRLCRRHSDAVGGPHRLVYHTDRPPVSTARSDSPGGPHRPHADDARLALHQAVREGYY